MLTNIRISAHAYDRGAYRYSCCWTGWQDWFLMDDYGNTVPFRATNTVTSMLN